VNVADPIRQVAAGTNLGHRLAAWTHLMSRVPSLLGFRRYPS
jgi:hypothetical protein